VNKRTKIPDWETLLAHAALLQLKIPAAILVGGTAAAVHAGHRISFDHDHVKTFLVVDRNATRDYLDVAALSHYIGLKKSAAALESMNELYAEFKDEAGDLLTSVVVKLSVPDPYDLTDIDLSEYKGIVAPWNNWRAVQAQCASLAAALIMPPP
jgi:hypothetical protein